LSPAALRRAEQVRCAHLDHSPGGVAELDAQPETAIIANHMGHDRTIIRPPVFFMA
jgi:hypothetical protein